MLNLIIISIYILITCTTSRPKIIKVIFSNEHYCNLLSSSDYHEIHIELNEPNTASINPSISATISYNHPDSLLPVTSIFTCNFLRNQQNRLLCLFKLNQSYTYTNILLFYLKALTINNELIYFQNPSYNKTLELHSQYAKHQEGSNYQSIDFNSPNSNQFYIDYDNTINLQVNAYDFTLYSLTGDKLSISQYCFTQTVTTEKDNTRVVCELNPRIHSLANTFYAVHYTNICGFHINSKITFNVKGVVIDFIEGDYISMATCEEGLYLINQLCKSECPDGTYAYNGTRECLDSCNVRRLLQQDKYCVKKCSIGYGLQEDYYDGKDYVLLCKKCIQGSYSLYETCVTKCPYGSQKDQYSLYCQLGPENPQYENDNLIDTIISCEEYNPCNINGSCIILNNIKQCLCNDNSTSFGFYCEITQEEKAWNIINQGLFSINSTTGTEVIDLTKSTTKVLIALTAKLLDQRSDFLMKYYDIIKRIPDATLNTISFNTSLSHLLLKDTEGVSNLIALNIKLLLMMLDNDKTKLFNKIIIEFNNFLKTYMQSMIVESTNVESYINKYISYLIWTDNTKSREAAKAKAIKYKLAYADFKICRPLITDNKINSYLLLHLPNDLAIKLKIDNHIDTPLIYLSGISYHLQPINLRQCPSIPILFPLKDNVWERIDLEKYDQYKKTNIDIYNPLDVAFNNSCSLYNNHLGYDIPLEERRDNLYQNKTFVSRGENKCIYKELNITAQSVWMSCGYIENGFLGSYQEYEIMTKFKIGNLPFTCMSNIRKGIAENYAFWLFIVLIILFIFVEIILYFYMNKGNYINDAYVNSKSEIQNNDHNTDKDKEFKDKTITGLKLKNRKRQQNYCKDFNNITLQNLIKHHPLVTIFNCTIINSIPFKVTITFFTIVLCLGFNAIFYNESYIISRKINEDRQSFLYPLLKEYLKIILTIIASFFYILIIRGITFVTKSMQDNLNKKISGAIYTIDQIGIIEGFIRKRVLRDVIAYCFMCGNTVLFILYAISFCANYINTSITWLYSSIWTMLIIWGIIAPVYLIIISIIEVYFKCSDCGNLIKKLLPF